MVQDHLVIGQQKDLTCKVSKPSLLKAMNVSIDQTFLEWVFFHFSLKTVKELNLWDSLVMRLTHSILVMAS